MLSHVKLGTRGAWVRLGRPRRHPACRPTFARHFSGSNEEQIRWQQYPVRILGPAIWSAAAIGTIFFTCAAFDVYQDAKKYTRDRRRALTFDDIEADRVPRRGRDIFIGPEDFNRGPIAVSSPLDLWYGLSGPGKVVASVVGVNALTLGLYYAPSPLTKRFVVSLAHTPVEGVFKYRQLLTSAFVHSGPIHFGVNMFVLINLASSLARTPEFKGSGSHTLAFYLSGGIISALGSQIACNFWPNKMQRFIPALGFSGVVSAIFAAWCMEHPDGRVRILFIPVDFTARGMLDFVTVFEALGTLGMFRFLPLAHSAHLSGLLFGAAYVTYGKGEKYWISFRRAAFRGLQSVGVV